VQHFIRFTPDHALPPDLDWALVRTPTAYYFFVKRSKVTQEVLEAGWDAYEELASKYERRWSA
jgi:hypothetical protein